MFVIFIKDNILKLYLSQDDRRGNKLISNVCEADHQKHFFIHEKKLKIEIEQFQKNRSETNFRITIEAARDILTTTVVYTIF